MKHKGTYDDELDLATIEQVNEILSYFDGGAARNALSLGGVEASLYALKTDVSDAIAELVGTAPDTLDTLGELATALKENADVVATLDAAITAKADKTALDEAVGRITTLENSATKVSFAQTLSSGTKIGSITIDGTETNIYAPSLSGYATQYWVNQQGFAKSTYVDAVEAMFDSYYTSEDIDKMLSTFSGNVAAKYASKDYLTEELQSYATRAFVTDELANNYYKKSQVDTLLGGYVKESALDNYVPSTGGKFNALTINYNFDSIGNYKLYVNGRTGINGTLNALQGVVIPTGKTLKIGDATLSWDSTNNALKVDKPMYSTGTLASGGVSQPTESELSALEARIAALEEIINV